MITAVAGIIFALLHLREWLGMIDAGRHPVSRIPGAPDLFGGAFFSITGLHLCT